jgi:hypothetical protein
MYYYLSLNERKVKIIKSLPVLSGEEGSGQLCDEPAEGAAQPPHTQATGIPALRLFNSVILLH